MSELLTMTSEMDDNRIRINLSGEIDIYSAPDFKKQLYGIVESGKKDIVIDCAKLDYIDSTGLGILVGALKKVKQFNKSVTIVNPKDNIRKLFVITGLDKVFSLGE